MVTVALGILWVFLAVVASVAGLALARRIIPLSVRQQHNQVAGFIYAVVGIAYAVLLAFVVIAVWTRFDEARDAADREGNELAGVYWLADRFPEPERRQIQDLAHSYAQVVVDEEWPMMEDGQASPQAWALMDRIRESIYGFEPGTSAEQVLYDQSLTRMDELADARRIRLLDVNFIVPTILWVNLIIGGVITVGFTYLFGLENTWPHVLMVAALAVLITCVLFTIYTLDYPFSREEPRVNPDAMELDLQRFEANQA